MAEKEPAFYVLRDPRTKDVRYVGRTHNFVGRWVAHVSQGKQVARGRIPASTPLRRWLCELAELELEPEIELWEQWTCDRVECGCLSRCAQATERERELIDDFAAQGWELLNVRLTR